MTETPLEQDCSICLNKLEGHIIYYECRHAFHYNCIFDEQGFKLTNNTCPNCRKKIPDFPKKNESRIFSRTEDRPITSLHGPWPIMGPEYFNME